MEHLDADLLDDYLSGELDTTLLLKVDTHLENCAECRSLALKWQQWKDTLQELAEPEASETFVRKVMSRVAPAESSSSLHRLFNAVSEWRLQIAGVACSLVLIWISSSAPLEAGSKEISMSSLNGEIAAYEFAEEDFSLTQVLGIEEDGFQ